MVNDAIRDGLDEQDAYFTTKNELEREKREDDCKKATGYGSPYTSCADKGLKKKKIQILTN